MRVRLTRAARTDLGKIWRSLAVRASPRTADRIISGIEQSWLGLADFPLSGSPRDEVRPGLRAVFHSSYVVYYKVRGDIVAIMRIVHGAQDSSALEGVDS